MIENNRLDDDLERERLDDYLDALVTLRGLSGEDLMIVIERLALQLQKMSQVIESTGISTVIQAPVVTSAFEYPDQERADAMRHAVSLKP